MVLPHRENVPIRITYQENLLWSNYEELGDHGRLGQTFRRYYARHNYRLSISYRKLHWEGYNECKGCEKGVPGPSDVKTMILDR